MTTTALENRQDAIIPVLLAAETITSEAIAKAEELRDTEGRTTVYHLISRGDLTATTALTALGELYMVETVTLEQRRPRAGTAAWIPESIARDRLIAPLSRDPDGTLHAAVANPYDVDTIQQITALTGAPVRTYLTDDYSLALYLDACYAGPQMAEKALENARARLQHSATSAENNRIVVDAVSDQDVPRMVTDYMRGAVESGASDIHIEFFEEFGQVRYRKDGALLEVHSGLPPRIGREIINRVKVLAGLNSSQNKLPEDGQITADIDGRTIDFRVATIPTVTGEGAVLRILERGEHSLTLEALGLAPREKRLLNAAVSNPYGMILVTGPTGSGKTTTLYACLEQLNQPTRKILTAEDPVERKIAGITQVKVVPELGLTFAAALKSFLRLDPNVIMVGEVRDEDTARTAFRAAQTGHLVLSTLHTNDTAETVTRLLDLGIEPYNLVGSLSVIVAQRLLRRTCQQCAEPATPTADQLASLRLSAEDATRGAWRAGRGCQQCSGTGYNGRIGVYEIMGMTRRVTNAIIARKNTDEIRQTARQEGMVSLRAAAIALAEQGTSTLSEATSETQIA